MSTCDTKLASCVCCLPEGHEDKWHRCDCGGSWAGSCAATFEIKSWPGGLPDDSLTRLLKELFPDAA